MSRFYDLASDLLTAVETIFASVDPDPVALPTRRYVANGVPALDAPDQLTVQVARPYLGRPGREDASIPRGGAFTKTVELSVMLTRCVPVLKDDGTAPTVAKLDASAQEILRDGSLLFDGLTRVIARGELFDTCEDVALGPMVPYGPEGGSGGWVLTVAVQL